MAAKSTAITATTTAASLCINTGEDRGSGQSFLVYNNGSVTAYIGGPDVTTTNGVPLAAGATLTAALGYADNIYAVTASSTTDLRVLECGVG
jgi:hypothetical protein